MFVSNINIKTEPEEERAEAVLLTNFTKTSIFKIKEEQKEPERLSKDSIWLDDVKVKLPRVETESDYNTSDYLAYENIECETDIKVKQEFEQIEFISFPNIQYESNDYSNCNVKEENTKLKKRKTSTERVRRFREKQRQIKQQENLQKGTNEDIKPCSRRPRRSTKIPKTAADYCREYRQRIKEKRELFIQNNCQNNSIELEETSNINNLSNSSFTSKLEDTNGNIKPRSRRPRRSTKVPKTPAERCREYRQRLKENRERLMQNNCQKNTIDVEEPWHINNLSSSSSSTSNYLSNVEDSLNIVNLSEQQEILHKGTNEDIRPRSRRPRRSTKTPKTTADYCREYRQRIKEKRERLIQNNCQNNSMKEIQWSNSSSISKLEDTHGNIRPHSRRPRRSTKIPKTPAERCREYRQRVKENRERLMQNNHQNNSMGEEEMPELNIKIKIEPEEERIEPVSLTNFTAIFKIKQEPKEREGLSNLHVEDSKWLDDVKVEVPKVEIESDCNTSDYLGNENIECEIEIKPDIIVKQEFEQIEYSEHPV